MKVDILYFIYIECIHTRHKLCERYQIQPPLAVCSCILTWRGSISDQWGVSPKTRPFHCTLTWLTLAITANVGNSTVQFLVVGVCVRAHPLPYTMKCPWQYMCVCVCVCVTCTHMGMHRRPIWTRYEDVCCMHRNICIYVCDPAQIFGLHLYDDIMHAHLLWVYAGACICLTACMHMYLGHGTCIQGRIWLFAYVGYGPHSAVVQRRGNPWSGWSKPRSLDRELKIRLIYESLNERRTRY